MFKACQKKGILFPLPVLLWGHFRFYDTADHWDVDRRKMCLISNWLFIVVIIESSTLKGEMRKDNVIIVVNSLFVTL